MAHSLPYFYGSLPKVKTVENVRRGEAMKDFLKGALMTVVALALVLGIRFAAFVHLPNEAMAVNDPVPVATASRAGSEYTVLATHK
jgi:hypothetical protein